VLFPWEDARGRRIRLKGWQGSLHAASVVAAVGFGRFAVFDALQWATSSRPSEAVAAGALLLVAAAGCVPMVSRHYPTAPGPRGCLIGAASVAALLVLLRPPFPVRTGAKCPHLPFGLCPRLWDEAHAPFHEVDDLIVYGIGEGRREHQPLWLLVIACCGGLLVAAPGVRLTAERMGRSTSSLKYMVASLSASCVAGYIALEFFQHCPALQAILWLSMLVVASATVNLQISAGRVDGAIICIALWLITFPLALLVEASSPLAPLPKTSLRLYPDSARDIVIERHALRRDLLLGVYAAQAIMLAFTIKLKMPSLLAKRSGGEGATTAAAFISYESLARGFSIPGMCLPSGAGIPRRGGGAGPGVHPSRPSPAPQQPSMP